PPLQLGQSLAYRRKTRSENAHLRSASAAPIPIVTRSSAMQPSSRQPTLSLRQRYYWRVLLLGIILYYIANRALRASGNINLVPTVLLLGGVLGTATATLLEVEFVRTLSLGTLFLVALSEEFAKLLGIVWLLRRQEYLSEAHGLVFGAAAGMGFAAFESMGYGLTFFLLSRGNLDVVGSVLLTRGLLSPFGHGTWTALVASTMWRERAEGRSIVGLPVLGAFLTAVILHTAWDSFASVPLMGVVVPGLGVQISLLIVGAIGLALLYLRMRESNQQSSTINLTTPWPAHS